MAKILWIGDGGCTTGFARVTHSIGERLVEQYGHDVHVLATNYRGDYWPTSLKLYRPTMLDSADLWGRTRFLEMLGKVGPDVVVMLADPNVACQLLYENSFDPDQLMLKTQKIITYLPVDGYDAPPVYSAVLTGPTNTVVMSEHGKTQFPDARLILHGVDTETYRPATPADPIIVTTGEKITSKRDAKKVFGYDPDGFLVLRVDKNSVRKDFASTVKALWPVMDRFKDITVHLHCDPRNTNTGVKLDLFLRRREDLRERFFTPAMFDTYTGWPENDLAALYNAADIFVSTSHGEGFGLTLAESLACGTPVIAQLASAIPEVVGPGGVLIEPIGRETAPAGHDLCLPDVPAFTQAITRLYQSSGARRDLGAKGREHVVGSFSWDGAAARFHEYIEELAGASVTEASEA